jgi:predicted ATPase
MGGALMKVTVRNLGAINQAEFDLKPLTIFIGPNNSMKTWLAYTLAGILGRYGLERYLTAYIHDEVSAGYQKLLDNLVQLLVNEGMATIDLVRFA